MKRAMFSMITGFCYSGLMYAGYLFSFIWCATRLIVDVTFTYGTFTAIMQLVSQVRQPFSTVSGLIPQYYNAMASAERIMEIEEMSNEEITDEDFDFNDVYSKLKSIKICDLAFSYKRDKVFDSLNFEIEKGDFAAIVGHSGIGKSTLFKIMLGVYTPKAGSIDLICEDETSVAGSCSAVADGAVASDCTSGAGAASGFFVPWISTLSLPA